MSLTLADPVFLDACRRRNPEAWNLVSAVFDGAESVEDQETSPRDIAMTPDGTRAFVIGTSSDAVHQYELSVPWDITSMEFTKSQDLGGFPTGIFFRPDGANMYIATTGNTVRRYSLAENWDIGNITSMSSLDVSGAGSGLRDLFITADGLRMFLTFIGSDRISEYSVPTRWDTSTATHVRDADVSGIDGSPVGLFFRPDGRRMYFVGNANDRIYEINLATPWTLPATPTASRNLDITEETDDPTSVFFKPDGLEIFVMDSQHERVLDYRLGVRWNVERAAHVHTSRLLANPLYDLFFHPDGTSVICGFNTSQTFIRYDLSTAWDVSTIAETPHSTHQVTQQTRIPSFYVRDNGQLIYSIDPLGSGNGNRIYSYALTTAWDLSNVTGAGTLDIPTTTIDDELVGITVGDGGSKLFFCGDDDGMIYQASLGTAWDLTSTFTLDTSTSIRENVTLPTDLFFSIGGTQMFVTNQLAEVHQYDLSTPWDLSGDVEHTGQVSLTPLILRELRGLYIRRDGLKMYTADSVSNRIREYDI